MSYKLGCLPGKIPVGLRDLTYYAAGGLPQAPASVAVPAVSSWGMDGNDVYGDCGVAGGNHGFMACSAIAGKNEAFPGTEQIVSYYLAYTGGQDGGVVLSDYLAYVRAKQFFGHTVSEYAPVAVSDVPTLLFTIWAYGFAYTGISVTQAMMSACPENGAWQPWTLEMAQGEPIGGHCVIPATKILTDDLRWIPAGDLQPGDGLTAFEEYPSVPGKHRKFRRGVVERTETLRLPCWVLEFDDGTEVTAAYDHLWLVARESGKRAWVRTDQLRAGTERATHMYKLFDVWHEDRDWESGYLAAAFDGEGWLDGNATHIRKLGFAQRDNAMLETTEHLLKKKGFDFRRYLHNGNQYGDNPVYNLCVNTRRQSVRLLGKVRPQRLLSNFSPDRLGAVNASPYVKLIRKEFIGEREVVALQTDTRTYIAEGLPSHNCIPLVGYDDQYLYAVTWGQVQKISYPAWHAMSQEAWAVITGEFAGGDDRGVSFAALQADLDQLGK